MFHLDSRFDALYNAAGAAIRRDPTGRAGTDVGNELDLFLNFHLSPHQDILVGYSKLFAGDFIRGTGPGQSPELFYVQYSFRW
ncbi:MAG: alginate export family protein [Gemmataceae bacterium]|nr:alginate export family protein [Gemmataceae bacterium]